MFLIFRTIDLFVCDLWHFGQCIKSSSETLKLLLQYICEFDKTEQ